MERAVSLSSSNSEYITELGFQLLLQGKVKDAMRCYKNAMKIDETSVTALTGELSKMQELCSAWQPSQESCPILAWYHTGCMFCVAALTGELSLAILVSYTICSARL
jgi:hypothetical protein